MRIGIVCHPTFGGSGVIATELAISLSEKGHQVHLICYEYPVRLKRTPPPNLTFHKVYLTTYPLFPYPFYTLALASKIQHVVEEHKLDLLHVHYAIPHSAAALLVKLMERTRNFSLITTLHGTDVHLVGIDPSYKGITTLSIKRSDAVTAVSNWLRDITIREFGARAEIEVIPNFVNPAEFKRGSFPELRERYSPRKEKIILHISNFRGIKRVLDVVKVFKLISERLQSRLLLIGSGPERGVAEQLTRELHLTEKVNFLGDISYTVPFLSIADLFLLPSEVESFGLAALEAMSCGVPVIGTRGSGLAEVVRDGECGFLVEVGNIERMASLSLKILEDEELRLNFGRAGRRIAEREFAMQRIVPKYEYLYKKVLGEV
jgi:N-acetyl-alpha-D-glucosaminyl L-malate synthase BshA